MAETRVYTHADGRTQGAYVGSELEKILHRAEEWLLDGDVPVEDAPAPEPEPEPEVATPAPEVAPEPEAAPAE